MCPHVDTPDMNKLIQLGRNLLGIDDDVLTLSPEQEKQQQKRTLRWRMGVGAAIVLGLSALSIAVVASMVSGSGRSTEIPREVLSTGSSASMSSAPAGGKMLIHVVGAVRNPGIYSVDSGSRVVDAVMLAGGWTEEAQLCGVNMARVLTDGEQLTMPVERDGCTETGGSRSHVSLNRATLAQLDALPGVGATLAQRILDWRKAHGSFTRIDQLGDVSGISDKLLATLTPLLTL